jgi:hypothetical protein
MSSGTGGKAEYRQTVNLARLLLVFLVVAGGVTACDHSSRRNQAHGGRLFAGSEVRRAFAEAGIRLDRDSAADAFPQLRASFRSDGGISVLVYKSAGAKLVALLQSQTSVGRQNVVVTYPKRSRLLPRIRRALVLMGGSPRAPHA